MSEFTAVDVETANPSMASICQIGVVTFSSSGVQHQWETLVNPEDYFDETNAAIHGITIETVRAAPTFPKIAGRLQEWLTDQVVVSHMPFDRLAITRALEKYELAAIRCTWLDSAKVVRRAWPQFSTKGYSFANVAKELGIVFEHHNAQEDARAAGEILLRAMVHTQVSLDQWLIRVNKPILESGTSPSGSKVAREGRPDGPLSGETVVFTGALSIPRKQAADIAADAGCSVKDTVNKETSLLVVGDQDIHRLAGHDKSTKHRRAEELIAKGQPIRILVVSL